MSEKTFTIESVSARTKVWLKGDIQIGFFELMENRELEIEDVFFKLVSEKYFNKKEIDKTYIRKFHERQNGTIKYLTFEYLYEEPIILKLDTEAECWLHLIGERVD